MTKKTIRVTDNNTETKTDIKKVKVYLDYGFNLKIVSLGTINIKEENINNEEGIKNLFFIEMMKEDINIFGGALISLLENIEAKKLSKTLLKVNIVKKKQYLNIFLKDFETNNFIKLCSIKNRNNYQKESSVTTKDIILSLQLEEQEKKDNFLAKTFLNILAYGFEDDVDNIKNKEDEKELSEKGLVHFLERFNKITSIEVLD